MNENIGVEIVGTGDLLHSPDSLRWSNAEKTRLDMKIQHSKFGEIDFTADKNDVEFHGRKLFELLHTNDSIADFDPFYWDPESIENPANQIDVLIAEEVTTNGN